MSALKSLRRQLRTTYPGFIWIFLVSCLGIGGVIFLHQWKGIPIYRLTRDTVTVANQPFFIGLLSNLGLLLWASAATICLFTAVQLTKAGAQEEFSSFLYVTGILTVLLTLDDLLLIHEVVAPDYVGVPEGVIYGGYLVLGVLYASRFWRRLLATPYGLLGVAAPSFAVSLTIDIFADARWTALYEDSAKFVGIVSWLVYCAYVAALALRHSPMAAKLPHPQTDSR